jgi:hypothetical protein
MSGEARLTGFFLLAVGCRCHDGEQLSSGSIQLRAGEKMAVSFRITKNHRSATAAYTVIVKPKHFVPELRAVVAARPATKIPLLSCADFNTAVQKTIIGNEKKLTSYSFRRCFIQNIIQEKTEGDVTDWISAAKMTGHLSLEVLRTKYTPAFGNTL